MRPIRAVSMWMSALMVTSQITVVQTQSALTQWDPSLVHANPVYTIIVLIIENLLLNPVRLHKLGGQQRVPGH